MNRTVPLIRDFNLNEVVGAVRISSELEKELIKFFLNGERIQLSGQVQLSSDQQNDKLTVLSITRWTTMSYQSTPD
jgi:hypothetical protein